ncbi:nucleotidyltransferase family protein [Haloplasma contractile]|uniref:Polymerase nucleotidyl transferase domain-containing protein n=1 Tax=Haloplasma contractile SSD-17B TaxID=1033810 RepID=F7PTV4_9MOLU|nr:hypothetical protein [Haloplasma contractile]ERJ12273.1 hypothetical protein HLPCO_001800 [Haloplasma contractile SSD-17B]
MTWEGFPINSKCQRVSKKNSKESRLRALKIISEIRKELKEKYKFIHKLVGSATRNTIVKDPDNHYDLDFQLILTHNSKNELDDPTAIKKDFLKAINKFKKLNEKVEDSTTAITLRHRKNNKNVYSIDFVIIKGLNNPSEIIRRNGNNLYTWNQLKDYNSVFNKFNIMTAEQKEDVCNNYIIPRKCKVKKKPASEQISSTEIFIQEINNYT